MSPSHRPARPFRRPSPRRALPVKRPSPSARAGNGHSLAARLGASRHATRPNRGRVRSWHSHVPYWNATWGISPSSCHSTRTPCRGRPPSPAARPSAGTSRRRDGPSGCRSASGAPRPRVRSGNGSATASRRTDPPHQRGRRRRRSRTADGRTGARIRCTSFHRVPSCPPPRRRRQDSSRRRRSSTSFRTCRHSSPCLRDPCSQVPSCSAAVRPASG